MKVTELIDNFKSIRDEYGQVEIGYNDREQLQYWRQRLVFIYSSLAELTSRISGEKIYQERMKDTIRSQEFRRLEEEAKASKGSKKSATAIKEEIGATEAYQQWSKKYSDAYGKWQHFTDLQESIKLTIDSISSHLRGIQTSDYLDPK